MLGISQSFPKDLLKNSQKAISEHREKDKTGCYATLEEGLPKGDLGFTKPQKIFHSESTKQIHEERDAKIYLENDSEVIASVFIGHSFVMDPKNYPILDQQRRIRPKRVADYLVNQTKFQLNFRYYESVREAFEQCYTQTVELMKNVITWNLEYKCAGATGVTCFIEKTTNRIFTATVGSIGEAMICRKIDGTVKLIPLSCIRNWHSPKDMKRLKTFYGFKDDHIEKIKKTGIVSHRGKNPIGCEQSRIVGCLEYRGTKKKPLIIHKPKITVNQLQPEDVVLITSLELMGKPIAKKIVEFISKFNFEKGIESLSKDLIAHLQIKNGDVTIIAIKVG